MGSPHEYYDPMSESTMDDDYDVPASKQWYDLNAAGEIVPRTSEQTAAPLSDDTLVNQKLERQRDQYHREKEGLSDYGRSLLG